MAVEASVSQLPAGCMLGNQYELRETIATGGMGCVYLARDVALDVPVAVKVLRPELATSPEAVDRFRREALLGAEREHPNIVKVIDFGHSDEGMPYLVMEYVPGPSLAELVRRKGPQRIELTVSLMEQLLAALDELHTNGIAHGDVSADNLLLHTTSDGGMRLKLGDFGLARRVATSDADARPRRRESLVSGTPGYMAPEVIRGEGLGVAADVYSAGVVLHELLTGELPFAAPSPLELMVTQLTNTLAPPSVRFPLLGIPPGFDSVIARALSRDGADRFAAAHLGAALEVAARGHEPMSGRFCVGCEGKLCVHSTPERHDDVRTAVDVESITAELRRPIIRA